MDKIDSWNGSYPLFLWRPGSFVSEGQAPQTVLPGGAWELLRKG